MSKLAQAVSAALCTVGMMSAAQAASFVVVAQNESISQKLTTQVQTAGGRISARLPQIGVLLVDADQADFAERVAALSGVRAAFADPQLQFEMPETLALDESAFTDPPNAIEDDRFYNLQWGHAAVGAAAAWNQGYRGTGAVVAVLDSGVACSHPDIAPNLLGVASFVPGESGCIALAPKFSHGSHVAGTIAAPDNGIGTLGIAPEAKLIGVKVLSEFTGSGSFGGILQGIVFAADSGADVINMSLGIRGGLPTGGNDVAELVNATARAVRYAKSQNALVVVSAGNDGFDLDHASGRLQTDDGIETLNLRAFPAEVPGVLAVSATGPVGWALDPANADLDRPASYTNYGQSAISFAAPGGDFVYDNDNNPANPDQVCVIGGIAQFCWALDMVMSVGGYSASGGFLRASYTWTAGTSMAAPHVSGVAALVIGKHGGEMDPDAVERILRASADDLGKPGNDDYYGAGRVNAGQAVAQ